MLTTTGGYFLFHMYRGVGMGINLTLIPKLDSDYVRLVAVHNSAKRSILTILQKNRGL